jgi:hypothetical protein
MCIHLIRCFFLGVEVVSHEKDPGDVPPKGVKAQSIRHKK